MEIVRLNPKMAGVWLLNLNRAHQLDEMKMKEKEVIVLCVYIIFVDGWNLYFFFRSINGYSRIHVKRVQAFLTPIQLKSVHEKNDFIFSLIWF